MTKKLLTILLTLFSIPAVFGQAKEADPADVGSLDSIMKAVYASISGDAGQPRD